MAGFTMTALAWPLAEAVGLLEAGLSRWLDLIDKIDPARAVVSQGRGDE